MLQQSRLDKKTDTGNPVTCVTFTGAGDQYRAVWFLRRGKLIK